MKKPESFNPYRNGRQLEHYYREGTHCELWGHAVPKMSKADLIVFVGFLDEVATDRMRQIKELEANLGD